MGCSGCKKSKAKFLKEVTKITAEKTPKQKRIEARIARIKFRNERKARLLQNKI
jgi:Fe-S cluster biogenesis protein NfuA